MSHNITLSGVKIKDLDMLAEAAKNIAGNTVSLDKTATSFRTYPGQPTQCNARINMPGKHDIGLRRNGDGTYTPVYDPYGLNHIFRAEYQIGKEAYIGKLLQEYALLEAEYEAAQQGMTTSRVPAENGTVTLELVSN